ncbi:MAG: class I SAM-dependent methyltransferase [Microcoleaceae cyanobacterium]
MATFLRPLSYRYQWLYDTISSAATLTIGGIGRFHQLPLEGLTLTPQTQILDLCCGSGQATQLLVKYSQNVTGLDASPLSLQRAETAVPNAKYIEAFAESMPFGDNEFDVVHTSAAMHEMTPMQLRQIFQEVYRVLKPGGIFTMIDLHAPTNPIFWPGVALFLWLFETETAWQLLETDLLQVLSEVGFSVSNGMKPRLYGGGSVQVIQVQK